MLLHSVVLAVFRRAKLRIVGLGEDVVFLGSVIHASLDFILEV